MPPDVYVHFLHLFCAVRICSIQIHLKFLDIAKNLLDDYIEKYIDLYGIDSIGSNIHNLCHLTDDVKKFGPLPSISSYPFENALYTIKKRLRNGKSPLTQVANRIAELQSIGGGVKSNHPRKRFTDTENRIVFDGFILSNTPKNRYFLTKDKCSVEMKKRVIIEGKSFICGTKAIDQNTFFDKPFNSTFIDIYSAVFSDESAPQMFDLNDVQCKMVALKLENFKYACIPLLHTYSY